MAEKKKNTKSVSQKPGVWVYAVLAISWLPFVLFLLIGLIRGLLGTSSSDQQIWVILFMYVVFTVVQIHNKQLGEKAKGTDDRWDRVYKKSVRFWLIAYAVMGYLLFAAVLVSGYGSGIVSLAGLAGSAFTGFYVGHLIYCALHQH